MQITAEYPALGEQVSYPVNQIEGFELTIEEPSWSPFKGYTIRWKVSADSEEVYFFVEDGNGYEYGGFEYLERLVDEQWYRLGYSQEHFVPLSLDFALGGNEAHGLEGSLVQKYEYHGTRLEAGTYRIVLEMQAKDGSSHYLAAEFEVK